jgi:hypothetical protein
MEPTTLLTDREKEEKNRLVFSYLALRNAIGISGMILPVILLLSTLSDGWDKMQTSISNYYYTDRGDVLVVVVCVLSAFLFTYRGYGGRDNFFSKLAAICGFGLAFFPTVFKEPECANMVHRQLLEVPRIPGLGIEVHLAFAATFFLSISYMSFFLFPKSRKGNVHMIGNKRTPKGKRNIVYKTCGVIMFGCVIVLFIYFLKADYWKRIIGDFPITFWLETIALEAFGIAWLTKGETLWPDRKHNWRADLKAMFR